MTKIKKVVAMALAFLMIFSSASVLANAWTVTVDDGFSLAIGTKFFINNGTEWVETEKVAPGDDVKARVYIGTDYYSNSSTLLFFYDKDFFTHGYTGMSSLSVNHELGTFTGKLNPAPVLNSQVSAGYIDSAFLDEYAAISVNLFMPSGSTNAMYDDSTWIFEFDLTVAESATGEGDLFVKDTTVQNSTSQNKALVNVPKGPADGTNADVWPMWRWNANVTLSSQPVSTLGYVTFDANGGVFASGEDEEVVDGDIGDDVVVPTAPTRKGYTFIGWVDATDTTPTYEEAKATVPVEKIPYEPVAYNAFWIKNVNITFDTDGGSVIPAHEDVTPYTEFAAVAAPTKPGYTFVGWDERGNMTLPETYPDVNTTYKAIWAKDVVVSFNTNGADPIESIPGVAGEDFEAIIAKPSKEGHRFVKWSPALPTVFPDEDTTYKAIFETNVYSVYYYVEGKHVSNVQVEYGDVIPTSVASVIVPDGMQLSKWYTDSAMTNEFVEGTVMGTSRVNLYAKYEVETYNAIFNANGGKFADGSETVSVPTVYMEKIVVPAEPTKAGYTFAGWTPFADGYLDQANDMYFYATWNEDDRNVEYYADGNLYETFNLNTNDEFDVPADPYKEGYSFLYWSETEGGAEATLPTTMPELESDEPLKYYAVFEINEYTITWDVDGVETEKTYEYDETIEALADPTKDGYTFAGWANEAGEIVTVPEKMPANDVNVKATWTIESYTLKFDTDGGNEIDNITAEYNAPIDVPKDPTKEGHTFTGWNKEIYTVMPDLGDNGATETFTASWKVNNYTVTWVVPGQDDQVDTIAYGSAITAPVPTKTGYVFAGWDNEIPEKMPANDLTFTGSWNPATDTKYTVNIHTMNAEGAYETATEVLEGTTESTVEAVYTVEAGFELGENSVTEGTVAADGSLVLDVYLNRKTITISFNTNGGTDVADISGLYGAAVNATEEPTKKGYQFKGWQDIPATFPAADIEVTAIWSAKTFDATFNANGGTFDDDSEEIKVSTVFNEAIVAPADPTMKGHKFEGWTPAVGDMTEEGMSFTAVWTAETYDATFIVDGEVYATVPTVFGQAIVAPEAPTKAGYVFREWTPAVGNMTEEGMTFEAQWNNATDTPYAVTVYTMNTSGGYDKLTTPYGGETGTEATAEGKYTIGEGFKLSEVKENKLSGTIAADGSLELVVYIDRIEYTFTVDVDGDVTETKYLFGAAVAEPTDPVKVGYTFAGWDNEVPATMPANDVAVKATWTKNTDTAYKVIVNYTNAQTGEAVATEKNYKGTTENAIEIVEAVGSAENTEYVLISDLLPKHYQLDTSAANELTGTVAADGSTVLNVYLIPVKYTIKFDADGGKFADDSTTYAVDVDYYSVAGNYAPTEDPVKEGHTFNGWLGADSAHVTGPRTFFADWGVNQYTITFVDTGDVEYNAITQDYNTAISPVADPVKKGYTFTGWDTVIPSTMPAEDLTITATWTVNNYTVTWVVPGQDDQVDTVAYGSAITAPVPTKTGYVFAGWDNGIPATMPANDLTFTGSWNPATDTKYTVNIHTMNAEGAYETATEVLEGTTESTVEAVYTVEAGFELGENSVTEGTVAADGSLVLDVYLNRKTITISFNTDGGTAVDALTGLYGAAVGTPATTTKTGYTFAGWESLPATFPAADTTVKALWDINYYTITFNAGEGTFADGSKEKTVEFAYNTTPVAPETPSKVGYGFTAWSPELAPVTGDATYTAQFAAGAVSYTVETYIMDTLGSYGAPATETKGGTADTTATVVPAAKEGFTVDNDASILEGTIAADGSLVLKVYYIRNQYDFTVNVDGSETTTAYYYEATVAAPTAPTKTGYTFAGWDGEVPATMPAEDVTVTATWTVNNYSVTWVVPGQADQVDTVAYGSAITAPVPTKTGYVFAGWDNGIPATMPANDLTFTGSWNPATDTKYTVNIHTMNAEGAYETATEVLEGTTDSTVEAVYTVETGFELGANSVTEGTVAADGSLVLSVYLNRKTVTITFADTGDSNTAAITGLFGAAVKAPADPVKEGYTFLGWDKAIPETIPAEDMTITADWRVNSYTATWIVDGETKAINAHNFGTAIAVYESPVKAGYTFAGWAWTNDNGETIAAPTTMPAYNVTATATWTAKDDIPYTVEIHKMATNGTTYEVTTKNLADKAGAEVTYAPEVFEGFTFEADKSTVSGKVAGDGSLVLKAYYSRNAYTLTVNVDDKTTTSTVLYGAAVSVEEPSKEGYDFAGWDAEVPATMPAKNVTLNAMWTVQQYTVTFVVDGVERVETLDYGTAIVVEEPVKEGYRFVGWIDETDEFATVPATMPNKNLKFTAVFETKTYTVNYYVDNVLVETLSGEFGNTIATSITSYTVPVGYELDSWYTDAACETKLADGATIEAYTTNLYAKTVAKTYDAIFMVDGEVYATVATAFDADIIAPADPAKDGHVFTGWTPTVGTMDKEGITFIATWQEGDYSVTYKVEGEADQVFALLYGEEIDLPAEPEKEGYTFKYWSLTEGGEEAQIPATMPAENLVYYAVFEINEYTVTWVIDGVETVDTLAFGAAIVAPAAAKEGFTFKHWSLTENGEMTEVPETMGTENLKFYAVFKLPIKLMPVEGETGVIERNGAIESHNDGYTVSTTPYENASKDFDEYYVYGFTGRRFRESDITTYFYVQGEGYVEVVDSELSGLYGTGAKVLVKDNETDEVVEEFYVIIFGDIDGDARVNTLDITALEDELKAPKWSSRRNKVPYRVKAADLDMSSRIDTNDDTCLINYLAASATLDQTTGLVTPK